MLRLIGKNSLYYFCIHVIIIKVLNKVLEKIMQIGNFGSGVQCVISIVETIFVIGLVGCILTGYDVLQKSLKNNKTIK